MDANLVLMTFRQQDVMYMDRVTLFEDCNLGQRFVRIGLQVSFFAIVPSIDHLSSQKLGYCDQFSVKRSLEEHGTAGQDGKKLVKTLMYFEGCPKPLGCTVLLRGANGDELKKVKHVVQYGIFVAYHLGLETSFLADEGASLSELPLNTPITVALPDKIVH